MPRAVLTALLPLCATPLALPAQRCASKDDLLTARDYDLPPFEAGDTHVHAESPRRAGRDGALLRAFA
jgi:hypothetical protein